MSVIGVIPARMESSRFPGKPMEKIHDFPMVGHVYKRVAMSKKLDHVYVATCNQEIFDFVESIGGKAVMTENTHTTCSDRTSEAIDKIEEIEGVKASTVVMIQGDEPMVTPEMVDASATPVIENADEIYLTNLVAEMDNEEQHQDPNEVKVVFDKNYNALYFSREPIPSRKKYGKTPPMWKQVCVITFTSEFLKKYNDLSKTTLEIVESVDMNRVLEHGYKVKLVHTDAKSYAVDTPDDLKFVQEQMKNDQLMKEYL